MVEPQTRRIAAGLIACITLGAATPALAHPDEAPSLAYCEAFPLHEESFKGREKPIALPAEWAAFAKSSLNWIAYKTEQGATLCDDISWIDEGTGFERFNDSFVGYEWTAYEAWGYTLVDLSGRGQILETGAKPMFAPSGQRFAAIQLSEAGWGGFEGFGVWNTWGGGLNPIQIDTSLPQFQDWRIDRWEGDECLHLSAVPWERLEGDWENLPNVERDSYVAGDANGWEITAGDTCPSYDAP